jgi:hypothetical protein
MTKQDFEMIARVLRTHRDDFGDKRALRVAQDFADELQGYNDRFDRARFMKACGVTED